MTFAPEFHCVRKNEQGSLLLVVFIPRKNRAENTWKIAAGHRTILLAHTSTEFQPPQNQFQSIIIFFFLKFLLLT